MATMAAVVAADKGNFRKIRLYMWGEVKTLNDIAKVWLLKHGVEVQEYEVKGDLVPSLDEILGFF